MSKTINKKLILNKTLITNLNEAAMDEILGGDNRTAFYPCQSNTTCQTLNCKLSLIPNRC